MGGRGLALALFLAAAAGLWALVRVERGAGPGPEGRESRAADPGAALAPTPAPIVAGERHVAPLEPAAEAAGADESAPGASPVLMQLPAPAPSPDESPTVWYGRILERETDRPLAGATATTCHPRDHSPDRAVPVAESGLDGFLTLEITDATRIVRVDHPGHVYHALPFEPGHDLPETAQVVRLEVGAILEVRIVEPGGAAKAEVEVEVRGEEPPFQFTMGPVLRTPRLWRATTDVAGRCTLADLPASQALHVLLEHRSRRQNVLDALVLEPAEVRHVEWVWGGGCTIDGLLRGPDGAPAAGIALDLLRGDEAAPERSPAGDAPVDQCRSDSKGTFRFRNLPPGPWWIVPGRDSEGRSGVLAPELVIVGPLDTHLEVRLSMTPGLTIRGQVRDSAGAAAAAWVMTTDGSADARTANDGSFVLEGLEDRAYSLQAMSLGENMGESELVEARAGDEGIVLCFPAGGVLNVAVLDGGVPAGECTVEFLSTRPGGMVWNTYGTPPFALPVAPGAYAVLAVAGEQVSEPVEAHVVRDAETRVQLLLRPGARLRVRIPVPVPGASELEAAQLSVFHEGRLARRTPCTPGRDLALQVPSGNLELVLHSASGDRVPDDAPRRRVHLEAGEDRRIEW